jgi:hypothetical protein
MEQSPTPIPLIRPGTARALRRTMGPLADEAARPVSANMNRPSASKPARMPALGLDSLIAYQAAMMQRPVVAPVPVSSKLKPFATRDLLASQSVRVSSAQRAGTVNPIVGGIAQSLIDWQQRARQGIEEGIAAAEAEEAAAAAVEDVADDDGLDWSRFDTAAASSRLRPLSATAGRRTARSPSAGRTRSPGIGVRTSASTPALLLRPPSAYDRYLLRRRQEVVEAQNEADIARALDQWRENKTAVDAEIERRILARRRPQSGGLWGQQQQQLGEGGTARATATLRPPPTPVERGRGWVGGLESGGAEGEEDMLLFGGGQLQQQRGASPPQHPPSSARGHHRGGGGGRLGSELDAVPEEEGGGGGGGPLLLREAPTLPFTAARTSSRGGTTPFAVTAAAGGSTLDGGTTLKSHRPSMMQWWGTQVRAQSAAPGGRSASSLLGHAAGAEGGSAAGGGGAEDGRPWSAWATTRAVLPPRSAAATAASLAAATGGAPGSAAPGDAAAAGAAAAAAVRPQSSGRLQALMGATQRPRTAADLGEMTFGTSGVDVLSNSAAIRYHVYNDARADFEHLQGLWNTGRSGGGTEGGPLSPEEYGDDERRGSVAGFRPSASFLPPPAISVEAAARVFMPSLACISLDAAKQQLDAIPQTRVQPFAGASDASLPAGKGGSKPAAKAAPAKAPAKAGAAARPGSAGAVPRKSGPPAYSVTVGPRQWSAGGAASTFAFSENPLLLERRLQALRDDALGIGKKKKKGGGAGAKKKKK